MQQIRRSDFVEPELSYKIIGALYDAYNGLGAGHREIAYQRALSEAFKDRSIPFEEQVLAPLIYREKKIGTWHLDFLVGNKVVVEIKRREQFLRKDIDQVYDYLKSANLKLGILAHFTKTGVRFKRIVNLV